jgi:hypothetical protein
VARDVGRNGYGQPPEDTVKMIEAFAAKLGIPMDEGWAAEAIAGEPEEEEDE